jgi:hypothetical protein
MSETGKKLRRYLLDGRKKFEILYKKIIFVFCFVNVVNFDCLNSFVNINPMS